MGGGWGRQHSDAAEGQGRSAWRRQVGPIEYGVASGMGAYSLV